MMNDGPKLEDSRVKVGELVRPAESTLTWLDAPGALFEMVGIDDIGIVLSHSTMVGDILFCQVLFGRLGPRWVVESTLILVGSAVQTTDVPS